MQLPSLQNSLIQQVQLPGLVEEVSVYVKRDDLIHPVISGNKWRKLSGYMKRAKASEASTLLTFGGAYSNHLHATAYAGMQFGYRTIGVIRGGCADELNPTLSDAQSWGMELIFLGRKQYRNTVNDLHYWRKKYSGAMIIPEGGRGEPGMEGCKMLVPEIEAQIGNTPDYIVLPCGTGTTLAGAILGNQAASRLLGISVLKGDFMKEEVAKLLGKNLPNWGVEHGFHFGGYARFDDDLLHFINEFQKLNDILLDPVYTGKMVYAVCDLIAKGSIRQQSTIVMVHTGGLQGCRGFKEFKDRVIPRMTYNRS